MQGRLSVWLIKHGLVHRSLGFDYQGIETLQIKPEDWHSIAVILYVYGYNYLRSQCAYDVAPGGLLASVYHLTRIEYAIDQPEEVCIKVFVPRRNPRIPSVFWVWKSADFQERESYDMLGIYYDNHPRLKLLKKPNAAFLLLLCVRNLGHRVIPLLGLGIPKLPDLAKLSLEHFNSLRQPLMGNIGEKRSLQGDGHSKRVAAMIFH
ncbi:hypothetical protein F8388_008892 [Cannabis sativa]|uniref:NAD(P)H dehydrogenase subunit J n=1 Tax=Cannabis sativa TaxID=3483 RepID=A0A7J6HA57_CANSA|nr:hypothetical protein F8388_008892 [Cannabis sativa]